MGRLGMPGIAFKAVWMAAITAGLIMVANVAQAGKAKYDPWPDLKAALFQDRPIMVGDGVIRLDAPYRAHDAAIVPITMAAEFPQTSERYIKTITLIVDNNPAPVASVFHLTPHSGSATI